MTDRSLSLNGPDAEPIMHSIFLTPRQTQVAVLVARGYGYKDIGHELRISHHTARALVVQITNKIPDDGMPPLRRLMRWMLDEANELTSARGAA